MEKIFCEELEKPELSEETLAHYGVIGMKWGIRKNPQKAWVKANIELAKRKKKAGEKTKRKVSRLSRQALRANKKASRKLSTDKQKAKAFKKNAQLDKAINKSSKADKRAAKWERQMKDIYSKEYKRRRNAAEKSLTKDIINANKTGSPIKVSNKTNKLVGKSMEFEFGKNDNRKDFRTWMNEQQDINSNEIKKKKKKSSR